MPIDSSIALGYRPPQFESPVNQMAGIMQLQNAQQSNQLNALGLQEKQRGIEDNNRLRDLYAQPDFDPNTDAGIAAVGRIAPAQATAMQKARLDAQESRSKINKQDVDALDTSLRQFRSFVPMVQSPEQVASYVAALYDDPKLGPLVKRFGSLESVVAANQKLFTDNPKQWQISASGMTGDKLVETLKGTRQNLNLVDVYQGSTVDYLGNVIPGSVTRSVIGQSADNKTSTATTRRGQDMTDARMRDKNNIDAAASVADGGGPSQAAFTKQFGKAPAGFRWIADGSMEPIPGGPADRKANEQTAGKETVDSVVTSLRSAYDSLDKGGGITSTSKGALSNIAASVSKSGVGQMTGGAVGSQNQKERDSIAQTRPLLLQAIMKATGMSAKQMDSNAELKLYLATATDPTLSLEANREALDRIESLYGSGALGKPAGKTVTRTGKSGGRKVVEYSDGSIEYAD